MHFVFMFDQFKLGEQWHVCIWTPCQVKFGDVLQIPLQCTSFKWNDQHIATMNITLYHSSCDCAFYLMLITLFALFSWIEVEPKPEITASVEDTPYDPRQQGKQNPIDHVDKIPLP